MEGAHNYPNSHDDFKYSHKMEIETNLDSNHSKRVKNFIMSQRKMNSTIVSSFHKNEPDIDIIEEMNKVLSLMNETERNNIFGINPEIRHKNKSVLENLVKIRKELSKENIPLTKLKNILNNNIHNFIDKMIESLNTFKVDEQLECLWIINNLVFYISKYNNISIDSNKISNLLCDYLVKIENSNQKNALIEKLYRIFGNLISINVNTNKVLIDKNLINYIINSLNNPVVSFRISCLWLLNKILISLRKNNLTEYINHFINESAIYDYNLLFSRIKKIRICFDEISEFFWMINELVKYHSFILIPIFFTKTEDINNLDQKQIDNSLRNFSFVLDNSLTNKMSQVSFRLISNLLVICNNDIKNEYLLTKFTEYFFERKNIILFINDILNSPKNKYDILMVKDALLLLFNLICLSPIKSCIYFKKGIVNLISDRDFQVNKEIMKLLYKTYYRLLISNAYSFEPNDEKVIRACLSVIKRFKEDGNMLIFFNDILYYYLKASRTNIDNEIEREIASLRDEERIDIDKYLNMFLKLANIARMNSPLSKFMRNL